MINEVTYQIGLLQCSYTTILVLAQISQIVEWREQFLIDSPYPCFFPLNDTEHQQPWHIIMEDEPSAMEFLPHETNSSPCSLLSN